MTRVVVSVGTDHHPYARMLDWMAEARRRLELDVFVQRGATPAHDLLDTTDYVAADELAALMISADVVVCHGGPGTISLAQRCGHRPIVMARNPTHGEHVDDHQMRYVAKLVAEGSIVAADDLEQLIDLLSQPQRRVSVTSSDDTAAAVEQFGELVRALFAGELPRRRLRDRLQWRREA